MITLGMRLAAKLGAKVILLHVISPSYRTVPFNEPDCAVDLVNDFCNRHLPATLFAQATPQIEIRIGDMAEEILRYVAESSVDMVFLSNSLSQRRLPELSSAIYSSLSTRRRAIGATFRHDIRGSRRSDHRTG